MEDVRGLSDRDLLERCERYGREALFWRNKFRALLPEVERRKLYLKKGFSSIYVFGMVLAGLSEAQVDESLNIVARLRDKPALRKLLEGGEVSVSKITKIMSIATPDNQAELAEKIQVVSTRALETFVRDVRREADFFHVKKPESKLLFAQGGELGLNIEVIEKLRTLKEKGIDINDELMEFLRRREAEIERKKREVASALPLESGRYVPKRVRELIEQEYGAKCAKSECKKPARCLHHTARYGITRSHDPHYLAPLCREHHELAHALDVKVQEKKWRASGRWK